MLQTLQHIVKSCPNGQTHHRLCPRLETGSSPILSDLAATWRLPGYLAATGGGSTRCCGAQQVLQRRVGTGMCGPTACVTGTTDCCRLHWPSLVLRASAGWLATQGPPAFARLILLFKVCGYLVKSWDFPNSQPKDTE